METSVLAKQRNKLIAIGVFLVLVVIAIGREDSPGLIPAIAQKGATEPERVVEVEPQPAGQQSQQNPAAGLDSWYAETAGEGADMADPVSDASPQGTGTAPAASPQNGAAKPTGGAPVLDRPPGYKEVM